jgi:hypothetical protein
MTIHLYRDAVKTDHKTNLLHNQTHLLHQMKTHALFTHTFEQ